MKKTYQFRIYPDKSQEIVMNRTLSICRHLYNEWINYYDQKLDLTANKIPYQKEVHSQVLQDVIKRVDKSFKNFYNGFGYPRFQGKNRYNSFTYPQSGFGLKDGKLILSKIGRLKIILHREIQGKIKTCSIKKDIDQWYVSFSCDIEAPMIPVEIKTETGIDVGLSSLITLSDGTKIEPPEFLRESEDKLTQEQKRLSRKEKGSGKRNKQRIKVSKLHRKIRNQRKDFNHRTSRVLVDTYYRN